MKIKIKLILYMKLHYFCYQTEMNIYLAFFFLLTRRAAEIKKLHALGKRSLFVMRFQINYMCYYENCDTYNCYMCVLFYHEG